MANIMKKRFFAGATALALVAGIATVPSLAEARGGGSGGHAGGMGGGHVGGGHFGGRGFGGRGAALGVGLGVGALAAASAYGTCGYGYGYYNGVCGTYGY